VGAPTRGRPLVYRRVLTDTSPESLSCALAHIACGLHSASAAVNTKLALQLVRAFAAYFRERAWPLLLMRGALAALSPCSWDLMPRHLCGRSILSDGASPPAAPSLFGWHRICVCAILAVAGDCFLGSSTRWAAASSAALVALSWSPQLCHDGLVHLAARGGGPTAHSWCCCCITSRGVLLLSLWTRRR